MDLLVETASSVIKGIKLTSDLPELHDNDRCPMLDIEVWAEREGENMTIRHSFYEKPVTSPMVFHANGVYDWRCKLVTMSEELRRRLLHMDGKHSKKDTTNIVRKFFQKIEDSGYGKPAREEVIR